jgi:hypothetical protein
MDRPPRSCEPVLCCLAKASQVLGVEQRAGEEPSGRRFLPRVLRHTGWPWGVGVHPVEITDTLLEIAPLFP